MTPDEMIITCLLRLIFRIRFSFVVTLFILLFKLM